MGNILNFESVLLINFVLMIAFFTYDSRSILINNKKNLLHKRLAFFSQLLIVGLGTYSVQLILMGLFIPHASLSLLLSLILLYVIWKCGSVVVWNQTDKRMVSNIVFCLSIIFLYFFTINNRTLSFNIAYSFTPLSFEWEGSFLPYLLAIIIIILFINQQMILTVQEKNKRIRETEYEQEFQHLYQHPATVVISTNLDGRITHANQGFLVVSGYSLDEVKGKYLHSFLSSESKSRFVELIKNLHKSDSLSLTVVLQSNIHTIKQLSITIYPILAESKIKGIFVVGNFHSEHMSFQEHNGKASLGSHQFLTQISHEVKTPLNSILGYAQLMKMDSSLSLNEKQTERIDKMIKSGNHLLQLINEVMNLKKYEKGQLNLSLEHISIHQLIEDSIHIVTPLALEKKVEIITNLDLNHEVFLRIDSIKMMQALLNLLANAIKFNHYEGKIVLSTEKKENDFHIFISDTGVGMNEEEMKKIFFPFYRASKLPSDQDGIGIGLTISKNLIEMMEGTITVKSSKDKGSTFIITFNCKCDIDLD
ncbi:sensor histidine kinase [Halalkalibacter nanhaiisediminis]|uniref:histidine kinase n=1 Tax=Halalkalibacter nanhaiisediminis TaxID=688079 RepID=A0A562QR33_9BACI|nr:PAS domain-containing sensor histidine kinase [Halalkalibacter nanhaiisediminis]TWI59165.1 PAS domain S-box-containing protein [Halalkalibacter nanhaiisediminis]